MQTKSDSGTAAIIIAAFGSHFILCTILTLCSVLFALSNLEAQVPQGFNYQAIARDASGNPITGATIKVKLSVLSDTTGFYSGSGGVYIWEEEHVNVKTNSFGMFTVVLGSPTATKVQGTADSFSAIDWSLANLFIGTKIAQEPAYIYKVMGSAKLWSVPYALRANTSASEKWSQDGNNIYFFPPTFGKVGIWTSNPLTALTVTENSTTGITYPLYIQNASADWTATEKGVGLRFGRINPTSGHDYGSIRGTIASGAGNMGRLQLTGGPGNDPHVTIDYLGNMGIGTVSPGFKLDVVGRARFQAGGGSAGFWLMNDANTTNRSFVGMYNDDHVGFYGVGSNWGMVMNVNNGNVGIGMTYAEDKLDLNGVLSLRQVAGGTQMKRWKLYYNANDAVDYGLYFTKVSENKTYLMLGNGGNTYFPSGNLIVGSSYTNVKLSVQPPSDWSDDIPLFEVKNKYGFPVFAVYNNGIRILVEDTDGKGVKGGFAIGGFDPTKAGETVNLMMVSSDSVRINLDNNPAKAVKGGFAIGSFDDSKTVNPREFMQIMPQSSVSGEYNTFIGFEAGKNMKGPHNTVIGKKAGYSIPNNNAAANVFIGEGAGMKNFGGYDLYTIILPDNSSTTAFDSYGGENVAIGYYSGVQLSGDALHKLYGKRNVLIGAFSGYKLKEGRENTIVGYSAGANLTAGRGNVFIGFRAGEQETGNYKLYIDNSNTTDPLIYGDFDLNYIKINGDIQYTGAIYQVSDINLKTNIKELENPIEKLMKIRGITFNWNQNATNDLVVSDRSQIGVLAQEVELVFPELVSVNEKGYKSVDYIKMTPILLEAVKEQQKIIEEQKSEIELLKQRLSVLEAEVGVK